jgi:hypothetical protein
VTVEDLISAMDEEFGELEARYAGLYEHLGRAFFDKRDAKCWAVGEAIGEIATVQERQTRIRAIQLDIRRESNRVANKLEAQKS